MDAVILVLVIGNNIADYNPGAPVFIANKGRYKGISPQRVVHHPISSHLAELTCHFAGFPDSVTWYKDGQEIGVSSSFTSLLASSSRADVVRASRAVHWSESPSSSTNGKYASTKYSLEDEGVLYYKLSIEPFEPSDVGVYTCLGSNRYASDGGTVHLVTGN